MTAETTTPPETTARPSVVRARRADLDTELGDLVALHDRAGVPLRSHVTQLVLWSRATGEELTALVVEAVGGGDDGGKDEGGPARLLGAALLSVRSRPTPAGPVALVRLAGHGWSDEQRLVAQDETAADALADAILDLLGGYRLWRLELEQLPTGDPVVRALARRHPHTDISPGDPLPQVRWPTERTERTWASKKARQKSRRAAALADETGRPWAVSCHRDVDDLLAALPETLEVRSERELDLDRADELADPRLAEAHRTVVTALAREGRAELWLLRVGDELVMYVLAAHDRGVVRLLDSRMRAGWTAFSPGILLFSHALQAWHADPGTHAVDLGRGVTDFKRQLRTVEPATEHALLWSHPRLASLERRASGQADAVRRALRTVRDGSPAAHALVRLARRAQTRGRSRR